MKYFVILMTLCLSLQADYIWLEGEKASKASVKKHGWYNSVNSKELSGGGWLSNFGKSEGKATYNFESKKASSYNLWVRANPLGKPTLELTLNGGSPIAVDFKKAIEKINIAADNKPDMRYISWVNVGKVDLKQGANILKLRMASKNNNHGGVDAILFTEESFEPNGKMRPGQKLTSAMKGYWAFDPDLDDGKGVINLRSLNEKTAGQSGYIRRSDDGNSFVKGDGTPIRFWAVNTYAFKRDDQEFAKHAAFLARRGVNMVRFHGHLNSNTANIMEPNKDQLDKCWRMVATMKKEGIYSTVSPYWGTHAKVQKGWDLEGLKPGDNMPGVLFWNEKLQAAYKNWWRKLLTETNPYTGIPLAKDPALAVIQLQNEDSLLFWTIDKVKGKLRENFGKKFGEFLVAKYGSIETAASKWGAKAKLKGDNFSAGIVDFYGMWNISTKRGDAKRIADQVEFYGTTMYKFNKMMGEFFKSLGCKQLVNAGNWKTADQVKLLDVERWSYTANEVIGANKYYGPVHVNPTEGHKAGYMIVKNDYFANKSVMSKPRSLPVNFKHVAGYPTIISESTWVGPMKYRAEGSFLVSAYSSLSGFDTFYWFATGEVNYGRPMGKFQNATPMEIGQFPAAALMFRKGYIQEGKPIIQEERSLKNMWKTKNPVISEDGSYDPNRDKGDTAPESNIPGGISPMAFLVGPVQVKYEGNEANSKAIDLSQYISDTKVKSVTGELEMDLKQEICTLNSPKAQGVVGYLSNKDSHNLSAVSIKCKNEYASILAVSYDGKALDASSKVLVQIGTHERPYGWKVKKAKFKGRGGKGSFEGLQILDRGGSPWNIEKCKGEIAIKNKSLTKAFALDSNFKEVKALKISKTSNGISFALPEDALYVIVR